MVDEREGCTVSDENIVKYCGNISVRIIQFCVQYISSVQLENAFFSCVFLND
jgi:hypothetical protein